MFTEYRKVISGLSGRTTYDQRVGCSAFAVSSAMRVPSFTADKDPLIREAVFLEAFADLFARLRTSPATAAKPLPASPARAASTAAFRARIFVWKAISSIVLLIFTISLALESRGLPGVHVLKN